MENLEIRLVKNQELEEAGGGYLQSINASNFEEHWLKDGAVETMKWFYKIQPDLFFVALSNGKIVGGMMALIKPWHDGLRLVDGELFVVPEFQKKGIGCQLMVVLINEAVRKYNISMIEGITVPENNFPCTWYKSIGFKVSGLAHIEGEAKNILANLKNHKS